MSFTDQLCSDDKIDFTFTIIAVGKLGSEELNLSSDIDLIYLYNTDNGQVGNKSLNEFASKLSTKITSILSTFDESRFCFRVDTDLRPEGKSGPIANSVDAAIRFYNYWGGEMERMMLIRARPIAGNLELGEKFIQQIRPFIFRKSIDINSLGKIKETKLKIQSEATKSLKKGILLFIIQEAYLENVFCLR